MGIDTVDVNDVRMIEPAADRVLVPQQSDLFAVLGKIRQEDL